MENISEIHQPSELLKIAEELLKIGNSAFYRSAVLEAISCLETYVHEIVFEGLSKKIDPLLVKWLKEKTRTDFDARLSVLAPVATGTKIDKSNQLWQDYKKAKQIRNNITHSGKRVTRADAIFVVNTVHDWLSYLVSTIEIELALQRLKSDCEAKQKRKLTLPRAREMAMSYLIGSNFSEVDLIKPEIGSSEIIHLRFGRYKVGLYVSIVSFSSDQISKRIIEASSSERPDFSGHYMLPECFTHGVQVTFNYGFPVPADTSFEWGEGGKILRVFVNMKIR